MGLKLLRPISRTVFIPFVCYLARNPWNTWGPILLVSGAIASTCIKKQLSAYKLLRSFGTHTYMPCYVCGGPAKELRILRVMPY
jgi:hypothetical protein